MLSLPALKRIDMYYYHKLRAWLFMQWLTYSTSAKIDMLEIMHKRILEGRKDKYQGPLGFCALVYEQVQPFDYYSRRGRVVIGINEVMGILLISHFKPPVGLTPEGCFGWWFSPYDTRTRIVIVEELLRYWKRMQLVKSAPSLFADMAISLPEDPMQFLVEHSDVFQKYILKGKY
jgi:hypothetical protein